MICPNCGHDMGGGKKCLRCGYEVKDLAVRDENQEEPAIEIDPEDVYISGKVVTGGSGLDDIFGGLFGDILGDFFGFGFDDDDNDGYDDYSAPQSKSEVVMEIKDIEECDENGNPIKKPNKFKDTVNKVKSKIKNKNKKDDK